MKIYNIVLALLLVVMMAGFASAALPTITGSSVTIESGATERTIAFSATDPDNTTMTYAVVSVANSSIANCVIPVAGEKNLKVLRGSDLIIGTARSTTCVVEVTDGNADKAQATFTVTVQPKLMLSIDKVTVYVNGDEERLDEGESFEAKPGDSVEFEIKITNEYSGDDDENQDVDIEDVEVTVDVEDWDDGDNEEFDGDDSTDINADDSETVTVKIDDIPSDISDGVHTITITVVGEDGETNFDHEVSFEVEMDIEKEDEDIRMSGITLEPATVSCDRSIVLRVKLLNAGTDDSDEIVFEAKNTALGISMQDYDIDLDESDSDTFEYSFKISDNVAPGVYPIRISSYFDMDRFDDQDVSNTQNVQLTVVKCEETTTPATPTTQPTQPVVEVVTPPATPTTPEEPVAEPTQATILGLDDTTVVVALVVLNVLLVIGILVVIGRLLSRR